MQTQASQRVRRSFNDKIDYRILHVLQKDGRISNLQLAEQVHLSPSAVFERVKRLQREGYILGYQARLSHEKLGMEVVAFVEVQLERMNPEVMQRFEQAVNASPYIARCVSTTGQADYVLTVLTSDIKHYEQLLHDTIFKLPGVTHVRSSIVLREIKSETALPLDHLLPGKARAAGSRRS